MKNCMTGSIEDLEFKVFDSLKEIENPLVKDTSLSVRNQLENALLRFGYGKEFSLLVAVPCQSKDSIKSNLITFDVVITR